MSGSFRRNVGVRSLERLEDDQKWKIALVLQPGQWRRLAHIIRES